MATSAGRRKAVGRVARRLTLVIGLALPALAWLSAAARSAANAPLVDDAPAVVAANPPLDARGVPFDAALDGTLSITFTEPVTLTEAFELTCERSQTHALTTTGGPTVYTFISDRPFLPGETCSPVVRAAAVSDHDTDDPPDLMVRDVTWHFRAAVEPVIINEIDTITPGGTADFIELYDGGRGRTDLSGLTLVLYRGDTAAVYLAGQLDGYRTDADGYFVIGASGAAEVDLLLSDDALRDGPDAIAIYDAPQSAFPQNAPVTTADLVDAAVYGPAGVGLLALLEPAESPLDENARGAVASDSSQRCPDGGGRPRTSGAFVQREPTAGAPNACRVDEPPYVVDMVPPQGARDVATDAGLAVTFSEPVTLAAEPLTLECERSGRHVYEVTGEGTDWWFAPVVPFDLGETCVATMGADGVSDADGDDPPDQMESAWSWSFTTRRPPVEGVLINEIDADTPGVDGAEFVELFFGTGNTSPDGLALVLFNGVDDAAYHAVDLDGLAVGPDGYLLVGNAAVPGADVVLPDGLLQNGPDAVALVAGDAVDYPVGAPVTGTVPIDAVVYGPASTPDAVLQTLLNQGQPQIDENGRSEADAHSNQRCPDGAGGPRNTDSYKQNIPTPGSVNDCLTDTAPEVTAMTPGRGATGVAVSTVITVAFDEPVAVRGKWITLKCTHSGEHSLRASGGPQLFTLELDTPLAYAERCTAKIVAALVTDKDSDDPPDTMARAVTWSFDTEAAPADFVIINEIDSDTPSTDTVEFIELYDGGAGRTSLAGLTVVLFNGSVDLSYRAIDLDGYETDANGYFVLGNAAVAPDLIMPDGALQNGPDAVALYAADAAEFPTNSPIRQQGLLDALVYGDPTAVSPALLSLLLDGEQAADEHGRGAADLHSLQRCPNGTGGQRRTAAFLANRPTPGATSECVTDEPPRATATTPAHNAVGISVHTQPTITFDEPVTLAAAVIGLNCAGVALPVNVGGGPHTFQIEPHQPLPYNALCHLSIAAGGVSDVDADDPPDHPLSDIGWSFTTAAPPVDFVLINEVDADTPGSDAAEFIELFDGGRGHTDLSGLVVVLYNGSDDRSYYVVELSGAQTDGDGYLLLGNSAVPGSSLTLPTGILQNGADAVALYAGDAGGFPNGTDVHTRGLLDALVYGTADPPDEGLLPLLAADQAQVDEAGRGTGDLHSSGRCPNGAGGQRHTAAFRPDIPSPGRPNNCTPDDAPQITEVVPPPMATDLAKETTISVTFSEDVVVQPDWFLITCGKSGAHTAAVSGGPRLFTLTPASPFAPQETCAVTLRAAMIGDTDADDPPDHPASDYSWTFTTAADPANFVLINEIDADTPGSDTMEFIELYDGGVGDTGLSGLVVVFWNGSDDTAYRAIDLHGHRTDEEGYFVLGNAALASADLVFANGGLQNGPDAIGLYAGRAADFATGTPLKVEGLIDAVVYGAPETADAGLLPLLDDGQSQVNENGRGAGDAHSLQRCPNGAGGPRRTETYRPNPATPSAPSICTVDQPPAIVEVKPLPGAVEVPTDTALQVTFSEDVVVSTGWYSIICTVSGAHPATVSSGPRQFMLDPLTPFSPNESCDFTLSAAGITDGDSDDPPDNPAADFVSSFTTAAAPPDFILINEIDADTTGSDTAEFIELYDGGVGHTSLSGLVIVFWNGADDTAYRTLALDGFQTDAGGYFTLGNAGLPVDLTFANGALQNGPDAVGLYRGRAVDFPTGSTLTTAGLIDAVVYGPAGTPDAELAALLEPGQPQADEAGRGAGDAHSLQRCPDGAGGPRQTATYRPSPATPGKTNVCTTDDPPAVVEVSPRDGAEDIPLNGMLTVEFSEDVAGAGWYEIVCETSGAHTAVADGGPRQFTLTPTAPFAPDEWCAVTLRAALIGDADSDDPPDHPLTDYTWRFHTALPVNTHVLINEIDADTAGSDTAEFIELYDGGTGPTDLTGLVIVFWNGKDDVAYRAIDLSGQTANGYFVLGNSGLPGVDLTFANGGLQNGPDAVGLYVGRAADFPAGTSLTTAGLIDAVVYGTEEQPDAGLLPLLLAGQDQLDEAGRGAGDAHALQRCLDGAGGPRVTADYLPDIPTPGAPNRCIADDAPAILGVAPANEATGVAPDESIHIRFNEAVTPSDGWFELHCATSGLHPAGLTGGPTDFTLTPSAPFAPGERCDAAVRGAFVGDADPDDPPDTLAADFAWHFTITVSTPPEAILINEVDADTPGSDAAEFVELYDGGAGGTSMSGLVVVFWNGESDTVYRSIDLTGHRTDADGYFTLGNADVRPNLAFGRGGLQNGPDAVALYAGRVADFPAGAPLTLTGLMDAIVYGSAATPDAELLALLEPGQPQIDEAAHGAAEDHALQRCPDGAGGPRVTAAYRPDVPTPGAPNRCIADDAPVVIAISPAGQATDVAVDAPIRIDFNEDVAVMDGWYAIVCDTSGDHAVAVSGGPRDFVLTPIAPFAPDERCAVSLHSGAIHDTDADDPPDFMAGDYNWAFTTAPLPPPPVAGFVANGPLWIGETAVFTNTSAGPAPLTFAWDFGDGSPPSSATNPAHYYATVGTYTITLTVTMGNAHAAHSNTITILPRTVFLPALTNPPIIP